MRVGSQMLSARSVRWLDIGVAVWIVLWATLGVLLWNDLSAQAGLTDDVVKAGAAVRSTGEALGVIGGLPLVGDTIGDFADRIEAAGSDVEASGRESRSGIRRAAVIAGLGLGLLPAALVLLLYLPARIRWKRYAAAIAAALPAAANDPAFEQYLAHRAVDSLPWDVLRTITPDPWGSIDRGDVRALADAELARLGLRRP
ncbi:MAG: hypothetical protein GX624_08985 [Actinobacteria bacterium]|nr:hypothetical protein [Actinomycetota bacterium]